jgi:hypothetical protein
MELALGTVQFGMRYGIAGRGSAVPADEVAAILQRAFDLGLRTLDTAAAYGDVESRLAALMGGLPFRVVSKLPPLQRPLPAGITAAMWGANQVDRSKARLGAALDTLLFHRAEDLLAPDGEALWEGTAHACAQHHVATLGVSAYEPATLLQLCDLFPIALAQLPGSALDQRVARLPPKTPALHLRSPFLQGLLLMPPAQAVSRLPAATHALARWHAWCGNHRLPPLHAALGIAKGFSGVSHCVFGVDRLSQLEAIVQAWHETPVLHAPELACAEAEVIDPRRWKAAA